MTLRTPAFNDAKTYGFEWLRAMLEAHLQEGVVGAGDLKVTAAAAGGQRVDIAAGVALVKGDSGVPGTGLTQGLFMVANDAAVANAVTLNASDVTNPRLDQIVLRVRDSSDLGSGADDALFEVVQGNPTAGATLDNRNGAAALPNDRLRLADVLVPAGSSAVSAGNVRDRRPWARGAYRRIVRNANAAAGNDYTVASTTYQLIDSANLQPRLENQAGNPLSMRLIAEGAMSVVGGFGFQAWIDGAYQDGSAAATDGLSGGISAVGGQENWPRVDYEAVPAAANNGAGQSSAASGSHLVGFAWHAVQAGTATLYCRAQVPVVYVVREIVTQNADNS